MATLSTTTINREKGDLEQTTKLSAANLVLPQRVPLCLKFSSDEEKRKFCRVHCIGDHSLLYIGWPLGFPIIMLMGHPNIHSLSPYQLIKYLTNYLTRKLIALLINLITNQLRLTIDK